MKRRTLIAGIGAMTLPLPAIAQPDKTRVLTYVPRTNLASLDPLAGQAQVSVTHGYAVFDTLYGLDASYHPHPQMAEGHTVSDDGLTWLIRLRPGLVFHDGQPVLARDCIASVVRWSKRDGFGVTLAAFVDAWESADDRTIRVRLKRPFPLLPSALGKCVTVPAFIMPERLARTDPFKQVTEVVGSGPYRFLPDEYDSGSRAAYARFEQYVPRDEPADMTAGGKRAYFDRLAWKMIPDASTVAVALQTGEVDWWELVQPDLVPLLAKNTGIKVDTFDPFGLPVFMRFNSLVPPFDNARLRKVVLSAVDQSRFMPAIGGDFPGAWRTCYSMFMCGLPQVNEIGASLMAGPKDYDRLRQEVHAAGYNGERVVIINPSDYALLAPVGEIMADTLKRIGMTVDLQQMDFATEMQRRASREPVEKGGWSIFAAFGAPAINPAENFYIHGRGAAGWFGWFSNPEIETLRDRWLVSPTEAEQTAVVDQIQRIAFEQAPSIPLGIIATRTAYQRGLTGYQPCSSSLMWNIRRA